VVGGGGGGPAHGGWWPPPPPPPPPLWWVSSWAAQGPCCRAVLATAAHCRRRGSNLCTLHMWAGTS
jgi:hypothetical protein